MHTVSLASHHYCLLEFYPIRLSVMSHCFIFSDSSNKFLSESALEGDQDSSFLQPLKQFDEGPVTEEQEAAAGTDVLQDTSETNQSKVASSNGCSPTKGTAGDIKGKERKKKYSSVHCCIICKEPQSNRPALVVSIKQSIVWIV